MNKTTVLIVEDEGLVAEDLAGKLRQFGYEVVGSVASGEEAVTMASRVQPGLVLMDISLDGPMDGIQAAEAIRQQRDIPVIYLTAHSDPATLARAKITDPFGYILKPFEERELATQIELALYKHQADRELRRQREWLRVTLTSIGDAVIATDAEGRVTFINPVAELLTGWKTAEASGQPIQSVFRVVNEQTGQPLEDPVARVLRERRAVELANHAALVTKDGHLVPVEDSAAPILDAAAQVIGGVLVFHDVTEKRRAEERQARLVAIVDSSDDAILSKDLDGTIRSWNAGAERAYGYRADEAIGQPIALLMPAERRDEEEQIMQRIRRGERVDHLETVRVAKDGRRVDVSATISPLKDDAGRVVGASTISRDISSRKALETQARTETERLSDVLDAQREIAAANLDYSALLQLVLARMTRLTGAEGASLEVVEGDEMVYEAATGLAAGFVGLRLKTATSLSGLCMTRGELLRADDSETDPRVDREACRRIGLRSMILVPLRYDERSFGVLKLMSSHVAVFSLAAEQPLRMMAEFLGITIARKRAEEALRESEERLNLAIAATNLGTWDTNLVSAVDDWDARLRELLGVPPEVKPGYETFLAAVHPEDRDRTREVVQRTFDPASGGLYDHEYRTVGSRDGGVRWIHATGRAFFDETGRAIRFIGTAQDITERKRTEEMLQAAKDSAEQAKAAAEHANRAKDHFLAVLSHELRTPLTPVVMGVSMLQDDPNLDHKVRETLEMVRRNIEMEARLIDDLLDVSRIARGKIDLNRGPVELCSVIQRAVEVCKPDIEARRLHFGVDLGPAAPYWVDADAARLQQVFWNLLKNAIKFTPHDGCVGICCRPDANHVLVEVNDSGIGMEPEALTRVFNAFEQEERSITRQFGGLGLGLAISRALVEMHGGTIDAHSEGRDRGATFRVRLPLAAAAERREVPAPAAPPRRAVRPLRILLVEDHPVTAKIMQSVLTKEGHSTAWASDIAMALEMANQNHFDLLMSDLGLPDGSGHDLMRQLRERGHKFPGIALSGYGQEEDIRRSYETGFAAHLTKPASREAVVNAVASAAFKE